MNIPDPIRLPGTADRSKPGRGRPKPPEPAERPMSDGERRYAIHQARLELLDRMARCVVASYKKDPKSFEDTDRPAIEAAQRLVALLDGESP